MSENYDIVDYLTEPIRVQDWKNRGLPHDRISVENAIFITNTHRWPYIIDPQSQAIKWVYEVEEGNSLKVVKASDVNFMKVLEPALRLGKPVIIEVRDAFLRGPLQCDYAFSMFFCSLLEEWSEASNSIFIIKHFIDMRLQSAKSLNP